MFKVFGFFFISIISIVAAFAQQEPVASAIQVGIEGYSYHYKEPSVMHDDGILYGINAKLESEQQLYLAITGRLTFGKVKYQSESTGSIDGIPYRTFELRGVIGKSIMLGTQSLFRPYAGLGYRNLTDSSGGMTSTSNHYGYDRNSQYYYFPIGVRFELPLPTNALTIAPAAEYDVFITGTQTSYLSQVDAGLNDLTNTQKKGYGYRFSVDFMFPVSEQRLSFSPFYRYWNIKKSEQTAITYFGKSTGYVGVEPDNNTREYGTEITLTF